MTDRARGVVLTKPVPGVIRAIGVVEAELFDRIAPVKMPDIGDIPVDLDPVYDAEGGRGRAGRGGAEPPQLQHPDDRDRRDARRSHVLRRLPRRPTTPNPRCVGEIVDVVSVAPWLRCRRRRWATAASMSGLFARVTPAYAKEFNVTFPVPNDFMLAEVLKGAGRETMGVTGFHPAVQAAPKFKILEKGSTGSIPRRTSKSVPAMKVGRRASSECSIVDSMRRLRGSRSCTTWNLTRPTTST
jgi:hypothetical protein